MVSENLTINFSSSFPVTSSVSSFYPTCSPEQDFLRHSLKFVAYFVLAPIHFVVGLLIHTLCLWSVWQRGKKEQAYNYQTFVILSETFEIIFMTLGSFARHWCSDSTSSQAWWCTRNYAIMFYGGVISIPLVNGVATIRLLLSVAMALDRLLAMKFPFAYRNLRHGRHQASAVLICVALGLGTSAFDLFRNTLAVEPRDPSRYKIITDERFVESQEAEGLAWLRTVVRVTGLLLIIMANFAILRLYRTKVNQVRTMTSVDERKEKQRRTKEKTLIVLTVVQSIMTSLETSFYISVYTILYVKTEFWACRGQLLGTGLDIIVMITTAGNLYFALLFSKPFRTVVLNPLKSRRSSAKRNLETVANSARMSQRRLTDAGKRQSEL